MSMNVVVCYDRQKVHLLPSNNHTEIREYKLPVSRE